MVCSLLNLYKMSSWK